MACITLEPVRELDDCNATFKDVTANFDVMAANVIAINNALCELNERVGENSDLETSDTSTLVAAINEVLNRLVVLENSVVDSVTIAEIDHDSQIVTITNPDGSVIEFPYAVELNPCNATVANTRNDNDSFIICRNGEMRRLVASRVQAPVCDSPVKPLPAASDNLVACTPEGTRRMSIQSVLNLVPTSADNYVNNVNVNNGNLVLGRTGSLPNLSTPLPLNWRTRASGIITASQFVNGFPNIPGDPGNPAPIEAAPLGVRDGSTSSAHNGTFYINTQIRLPVVQVPSSGGGMINRGNRTGFVGYFRAAVYHNGNISGASIGGAVFYETDIVPITYWWQPDLIWIRFRPRILPGPQGTNGISITSISWHLEEMMVGNAAPF